MLLAKSAKTFNVPTILTTVETHAAFLVILATNSDIFPNHEIIERSSMNSWEDPKFVEAVKATGRKKLIFAALLTEVCLAFCA